MIHMKNNMKGGKKKMNKTVLTVSIALIALLLVGGVSAYQNGNGNNVNSTVDRTAAEKAIESGDYAAWKALHANSNGRMVSVINESNFYLLKQMYNARTTGDFAKVQEIRSQLGLTTGNGNGQGRGNGNGLGMGMHRGNSNGNCPMMDSDD